MNVIKFGGFSILLPYTNFNKYNKDYGSNYVCKITYINKYYNDEVNMSKKLKNIKNNNKYLILVDTNILEIEKNGIFYNYIMGLNLDGNNPFKNKSLKLHYFFMKDGGSMDLNDSINMILKGDINIWKNNTISKLKQFVIQMVDAIHFLHTNNFCHFDIKLENIVINQECKDFGNMFKLIDFAFAEEYPFKNYLKHPRYTAEYFPKENKHAKYDKYLPRLKPNDWKNKLHLGSITNNYNLIFKTDTFALGRVFYFIIQVFKTRNVKHIPFDLKHLIEKMTDENIYMRYNIYQCINHHYLYVGNSSLLNNCCCS